MLLSGIFGVWLEPNAPEAAIADLEIITAYDFNVDDLEEYYESPYLDQAG